MPIRDYRCDHCGHAFEVLVRGDEPTRCRACGAQALTQLLSVFASPKSSQATALPAMAGAPCGTCGNPAGPGACHFN